MPRDIGADQAAKQIRVAVRRHQEALPYCLECRTTSGGRVLESRFAVQRLNLSVHELRRLAGRRSRVGGSRSQLNPVAVESQILLMAERSRCHARQERNR